MISRKFLLHSYRINMKKRIYVQWSLSLFMLCVLSCSEDVKPTPFTYTQVFTGQNSKTWSLDKVLLKKTGQDDQQITLSSCEKDDRYIFYANGERLFEVDNGRTSCDATEDKTLVSYTWSFANTNATLQMVVPHVFGNFIIPFIVTKATTSEMILAVFADEKNTISYVLYFKSVNEN
jgi:hypothetical protein